jgi:hypothetical protein
MDDEQSKHLEGLLNTKQRRLRALEERMALEGPRTPPEVKIEIEDLQADIARIKVELDGDSVLKPKPDSLSITPAATILPPLNPSDQRVLRARAAVLTSRWSEALSLYTELSENFALPTSALDDLERARLKDAEDKYDWDLVVTLLEQRIAQVSDDGNLAKQLEQAQQQQKLAEWAQEASGLASLQEWEAVTALLRQIEQLAPGYTHPKIDLQEMLGHANAALAYPQAMAAAETSNWEDVIKVLSVASSKYATSELVSLLNKAQLIVATDAGDWEKVISTLKGMLSADIDEPLQRLLTKAQAEVAKQARMKRLAVAPTKTILQLGIEAVGEGNRQEARNLFGLLTRQEPDNTQAWIWLSSVAENQEQRRAALERAVELQSDNAAKTSESGSAIGSTASRSRRHEPDTSSLSTERTRLHSSIGSALPSNRHEVFLWIQYGGWRVLLSGAIVLLVLILLLRACSGAS